MVFRFREVPGTALLLSLTVGINQYTDITKHLFGLTVRASGVGELPTRRLKGGLRADKGVTFCIVMGIDLCSKTQFGVFTILKFMANIHYLLTNRITVKFFIFMKVEFIVHLYSIYFSFGLNFRDLCFCCFTLLLSFTVGIGLIAEVSLRMWAGVNIWASTAQKMSAYMIHSLVFYFYRGTNLCL